MARLFVQDTLCLTVLFIDSGSLYAVIYFVHLESIIMLFILCDYCSQ